MNKSEALQNALGYAAGCEDTSGIRTVSPGELPGFIAFAEAYADAMELFNAEKRHYIPAVSAAYAMWQETRGKSIIPDTMAALDPGPREPAIEDDSARRGFAYDAIITD